MQLNHLSVLVTGATGGIGTQMALELLAKGAFVLLHGRSREKLDLLEQKLTAAALKEGCQYRFRTVLGDLSQERDRLDLCQKAEDQAVNVLINNAGVNEFSLFEQTNISNLIDINVKSTLQVTQLMLPHLIFQAAQNEAMVVNIGSTFGSIGFPGYAVYCASKHAIKGFSEALRREVSDTGVKVLYLSPRATDTGMNSTSASQLNTVLGVKSDQPQYVARQVVDSIFRHRSRRQLGWPEKLQVKINAIFPGLVDKSIAGQLEAIKKYASP